MMGIELFPACKIPKISEDTNSNSHTGGLPLCIVPLYTNKNKSRSRPRRIDRSGGEGILRYQAYLYHAEVCMFQT